MDCMSLEQIKNQIIKYGDIIDAKGFSPGTSGNISVRYEDKIIISLEEPIMAENVYYFGKIPLADYALPSSKTLVDRTAKYFDEYNAVLMANHGFVVGDIDLKQAYLKLELAESYAQVVFNANLLGGAVLLSEKEVAEIEGLKNKDNL